MREGSKWLRLLVIGLLACTLALAGCSGDDGDDGISGQDGQDFQLADATEAGLLACSTCHGTSTAATEWVESKHAMNSSHTPVASTSDCSSRCHNPSGAWMEMDAAFDVSPTGTAVGCEDCHGAGSNHVNLPNQEEVANTAPEATVCSQCHDGAGEEAHLTHHPFNEQIYTRYASSGHGNSGHGGGFCSACHSHQGGLANITSGRKTSVRQLFEEYTPDTVATWTMEEEDGLLDIQCATCHDPHKAELRTSDTIEAVTYDDDEDPLTPDVTDDVVVYSAEFNLCTSCHMIALDYEVAGHGDAGALLDYSLSADSYSAANILDGATGTFSEDVLEPFINADLTVRESPRVVYNTQVFYHDNTPGGGRNFSDTHFAGTIVGRMAAVDESTDPSAAVADVELVGYKVNAANPDACTVCHDPHSANKVQGEGGIAQAQSFAEGLGDFHTNYLGDAMGHGCQPCHNGQEPFVTWVKGGSMPDERTTDVIACRSCHELEQIGQDAEGNPTLGDPTVVREFAEGHEFAFESGATVDGAELGVNQICFECHKGRQGVKPDADTTIQVYGVSYLHYAPVFATLFGNDSAMVPVYDGKTYAGRFAHYDGTEFGCVDCHNVHDTDGNDAVLSKMQNPDFTCNGCHGAGGLLDADVLKGRTVAYGERLLDTILATYNTRFDPDLTVEELETIISSRGASSEIGDNDLAKAASIFKIFNYEDGSPQGPMHGHGGSWAHNSKFARQLQYDAIEALGGDLTGLTRP